MSAQHKLARNTAYGMLTALGDAFFLLLLLMSGRFLGATDFGIFTSGLAVSVVLAFGLNLGLDSLAIRRIAVSRDEAPRIIGNVLLWKLFLGSCCIAAFLVYRMAFVSDGKSQTVILLLFVAGVLRSLNITCRAFLQSHERFDLEAAVTVGERVLICVAGIVALVSGRGVVALAAVIVSVRVLVLLTYVGVVESILTRIRWRIDPRFLFAFQREALPFGIALAVQSLYAQADILLLTLLLSHEAVGYFGAAYRVFEGLTVLPLVLASVIYPRLCALLASDVDKHKELVRRATKYVLCVAFLAGATGVLFSDRIIGLLFGEGFVGSSPVLALLLVGTVLYFPNFIMTVTLRSISRDKDLIKVISAGLAVKVAADLLLIPALGVVGAAVGVLAGGVVTLSSYLGILAFRRYGMGRLFGLAIRLLVASGLIVFLVRYLESWPWLAALALEGALFLLALFLVRAFDRTEWELLRQLWPSRGNRTRAGNR